MSKRLASFSGPSAPSSSPVRKATPVPQSPQRSTESTYHRKVRSLAQDARGVTRTWEELVKFDGLKTLTSLTDARTDLDNQLRLLPEGSLPRTRIIGPKLATIEKALYDLENVAAKLRKQFAKLNFIMGSFEELVCDAHKAKGWAWVHNEPLWNTWSLEKFATELPRLLVPYHRSLQLINELVERLADNDLLFEESKRSIDQWISQPQLEADEWVSEWTDICSIEIDRWDAR